MKPSHLLTYADRVILFTLGPKNVDFFRTWVNAATCRLNFTAARPGVGRSSLGK
jgi:hypothetical protein